MRRTMSAWGDTEFASTKLHTRAYQLSQEASTLMH